MIDVDKMDRPLTGQGFQEYQGQVMKVAGAEKR